jgi:threonine/homoserine/homoserine lactone efflux protein
MSISQMFGMLFYGMGIGIALAAPVGPINIEMIRRGVRQGPLAGWLVGLGALSCDTIFAAIIVSGLTPVADRPALRVPLFAAGALMLGYVGVSSLRHAMTTDQSITGSRPRSGSHAWITGFLMAALNPMGIVYWLSVGSALVAEAVAKVGQSGTPLLVGGVFSGILCWVTFVAILIRAGRRFVTDRVMRWISGTGGLALIGFAIWFAIQALRSFDAFQ